MVQGYNATMALMFDCSNARNGTDAYLGLFQRVAYTFVFVVGLVLNISALCFFARTRQMRDTHIYMLNLLLADFLLIVFLPFRIFDSFCPIKPTVLCTLLICVHYSNMYASIFSIMAISIHRFVAVKFPMLNKALEARRKKMAYGMCVVIWIIVLGICASFHRDILPDKLNFCYELKGGNSNRLSLAFLLVLEIVGYLLPIVIVMTCLTQAICAVLKSAQNETMEEKIMAERKNIVAIIAVNMIVFIVCFTPIHIGFLLRYLYLGDNTEGYNFSHVFYEVSEWFATTNCCLDSVGYYFLLKKVFRAKR